MWRWGGSGNRNSTDTRSWRCLELSLGITLTHATLRGTPHDAGWSHTQDIADGDKVGSWTMEGLLATIPVSAKGWVDLAQIRGIGEGWVRGR